VVQCESTDGAHDPVRLGYDDITKAVSDLHELLDGDHA
jgi:hypothetical protein